jgi:translation initiation factor IF-1
MPKNTQGGYNKNKKRNFGKREIISKIDEGQMYGQLVKNEGSHVMVLCTDNVTRIGRMSGKLKKGPRLAMGSFVVISLREFESDQKHCDIIGVASPPHNIITVFKKNNPTKYEDDFDFEDSDNEFKEFEQSNHTVNDNSSENSNEQNNNINFDDVWDDSVAFVDKPVIKNTKGEVIVQDELDFNIDDI